MGIQDILVIASFAAALGYIGRLIYRSFRAKPACGGNCKCGVDFSEIEVKQ